MKTTINNLIVTKATAIYSGGNIYLLYGKLENNTYVMGDTCNMEFMVVKNNPLENNTVFEDSQMYEWQMENLIEYIEDMKTNKYIASQIIDNIIQGNVFKDYANFNLEELKHMLK